MIEKIRFWSVLNFGLNWWIIRAIKIISSCFGEENCLRKHSPALCLLSIFLCSKFLFLYLFFPPVSLNSFLWCSFSPYTAVFCHCTFIFMIFYFSLSFFSLLFTYFCFSSSLSSCFDVSFFPFFSLFLFLFSCYFYFLMSSSLIFTLFFLKLYLLLCFYLLPSYLFLYVSISIFSMSISHPLFFSVLLRF